MRCVCLRELWRRLRAGSNAKLSLVRACELEPARHFLNVALSNSKELESKSKSPPGRTCGEGLRYCWTQDKPVRRPREFSLEKPNEHESNSPRKARRPARGERLRFLEPERRRTGPTGADREWEPATRDVPQPPPFRRRSSLSDASPHSGRIPPGGCSSQARCVEISLPACPARASRRAKHCTSATLRIAHSSF